MAKLFTVESMVDQIKPTKSGGFEETVLITYVTKSGYQGRVSLPKTGLTLDKVNKVLEEEANRYEAILAL